MSELTFQPPASHCVLAIVGNVNLDVRTAPIRTTDAVLRDGETSVAEIYEAVGGGGANTALAAARLGNRVHFCGTIGRDEWGRRLRHHLEKCGVIPHLTEKEAPTGRSIALAWDTNQRHFLSWLPSSAMLETSDIEIEALAKAGCRHLYRADVWFAPKMLSVGNLDLLRRARQAGMQTSLDLNWDPCWSTDDERLAGERIAAVRALLPHVDFIHGNQRELSRFTQTASESEAVESLLGGGAGAIVVHRGRRGSAIFAAGGQCFEAPARPVSDVVHPTGAGDAFAAAFMGLSQFPWPRRLELANDIAARHLEGSLELMPRIGDDT